MTKFSSKFQKNPGLSILGGWVNLGDHRLGGPNPEVCKNRVFFLACRLKKCRIYMQLSTARPVDRYLDQDAVRSAKTHCEVWNILHAEFWNFCSTFLKKLFYIGPTHEEKWIHLSGKWIRNVEFCGPWMFIHDIRDPEFSGDAIGSCM